MPKQLSSALFFALGGFMLAYVFATALLDFQLFATVDYFYLPMNLFDLVDRVRAQSRPDFLISVRLSPERFGMELSEVIVIAQHLLESGQIDLLDMSLWDVFKQPDDEQFKGDSLLSPFTALERGAGRLAAAGKITGAREAEQVIAAGVDIVTIGRSAILHHDFPELCRSDPDFRPHGLPVSRAYLRHEGLSSRFIDYMSSWEGFVADPDAQSE